MDNASAHGRALSPGQTWSLSSSFPRQPSDDVDYEVDISSWQTSNETSDDTVHDETIYKVTLAWTISIMITGCLGNILVVSAVLLHRDLRKIENAFIVNLAVADMVVSLLVNSFSIIGIVTKGEFYVDRERLCETIGAICMTSCACSMWSIAAIGVNRYVIICHWAKHSTNYNRKTVSLMLVAIWTISFLIALPNIVNWGGYRFDWKTMVCTADMAIDYSYTIYFSGMAFGIPLFIIMYSYVRIYYYAWKSSSRLKRVAEEDGLSLRHANDMKLVRSVLIIIVVFVSMCAPYALTVIIDRHTVAHRNMYIFSALLAHTNSSINCVIYAATNRNFRQGYLYFFRLISCRDIDFPSVVTSKKLTSSKKPIQLDEMI